ncbi:MAG: ABC transporter substrate-binding protein [Spirochaetota bacterium]
MKRNSFLVLLVVIMPLIAVSAVMAEGKKEAAFAAPRYGVDGFVLGAQFRVAEEKGWFADENVVPNIQAFSYGVDTIDAILAGKTDFGVVLDFALLTRLSTQKLVILATIIEPEPGWHKLAARDGISGAADLVGKKIGVAKGTLQEFVSIKYLQVNNVPENKVEFLAFASLFEIVAALKSGKIDAAWVWGQGTDEVKATKGLNILVDDSAAKSQSYGFLVVGSDYLNANRAGVEATMKVVNKATGWITGNIEEASKIIANDVGAPEDRVLSEMKKEHWTLNFRKEHLDSLKALYKFLRDRDIIKEDFDIMNLVDLGPLKKAAGDSVVQGL